MKVYEFSYTFKTYRSFSEYQDRNGPDYDADWNNVIIVRGTPATHHAAISLLNMNNSPRYRGRALLREWLQDLFPRLEIYWDTQYMCRCATCDKELRKRLASEMLEGVRTVAYKDHKIIADAVRAGESWWKLAQMPELNRWPDTYSWLKRELCILPD